jgi:hypothetical protein
MHKTVEQDQNKFKSDVKTLHNLAKVYATCESKDMKVIWQDKWYQMCIQIANRITQ